MCAVISSGFGEQSIEVETVYRQRVLCDITHLIEIHELHLSESDPLIDSATS